MVKKAMISGILFSTILLVGCNGEQKEEQIQAEMTEVTEREQEVVNTSKNSEIDESNLLSELQNEIIVSVTEQAEIDRESIVIMLDGNVKEISVSVGFPKDVKVDNTRIQQIIKDSIKKVSEIKNITINEENITITIEKY